MLDLMLQFSRKMILSYHEVYRWPKSELGGTSIPMLRFSIMFHFLRENHPNNSLKFSVSVFAQKNSQKFKKYRQLLLF